MARLLPISIALIFAFPFAEAQNQIVFAGYSPIDFPSVAPGQVLTLSVRGLKAPDAVATSMPLPTALSGISVRVKTPIPIQGYPDQLPIFRIWSQDFCAGRLAVSCPLTHIVVQIPTERTCVPSGQLPNDCTFPFSVPLTLTVEEKGVPGQDFVVLVAGPRPQILNVCQTIFGNLGGSCIRFVTHTDGTTVNGPNPARPSKTIVIYAVGLGPTNPAVKTGEPAPSQPRAVAIIKPFLTISHRLDLPPGPVPRPVIWSTVERLFEPDFVGLVPGYVGLYQINVTLPDRLPQAVYSCSYGDFDANTRIAILDDPLGARDGQTFVDICVRP